MKSQSTYQRQSKSRADWSSEVKPPSDRSRAASDTGLGGMERDWRESGQPSGMEMGAQERGERSGASNAIEGGQRSGAAWDGMESGQQSGAERDWQNSGDWLTGADALSVSDANSGVNGGWGEYEEEERVNRSPQILNGQEMSQIWPNIENRLPNDVIESPTTMEEVYRGSMKSLLLRNVGNYVVATFLIGTQTTVSWEGILYDVGNDYLAIYQSGRDQYIVSDLYSLKYVEFYDTRRRELCDSLLTEQEPSGNAQRG